MEIGNFVQHTSSPFSLSFSLHFVEIEFWWIRRGNNWVAPLFSPHPPFNQTSFPPLFFILPKIHPTKVKKIYSQIFNPQDCFFNLFTLLNFLKSFTFHNFSFFLSRFARGLNLENIALVLWEKVVTYAFTHTCEKTFEKIENFDFRSRL